MGKDVGFLGHQRFTVQDYNLRMWKWWTLTCSSLLHNRGKRWGHVHFQRACITKGEKTRPYDIFTNMFYKFNILLKFLLVNYYQFKVLSDGISSRGLSFGISAKVN